MTSHVTFSFSSTYEIREVHWIRDDMWPTLSCMLGFSETTIWAQKEMETSFSTWNCKSKQVPGQLKGFSL